jgi:hypothetical protein
VRRRPPRRRLLGIALAIALPIAITLAATACSPTTPSATPTPSVPNSQTPADATTTPGAATTPGVAIDASLLAVLPATVDGIALDESADGEAEALSDPALGSVAEAIAAGLAIDAASGEFVYAVVVRLRPGAMNDERFRDWRDTFDEGAYSQAGGVVGHAQAVIGGRTVYIGTCGGGVRTYHVWLTATSTLVSASSVGERRLGERLVEGLRP